MANLRRRNSLGAALWIAGVLAMPALADSSQTNVQQGSSQPSPGHVPSGNSPFSAGPNDANNPAFADASRGKRNDERQRHIESDADRLLFLANQLKSEVAASGAQTMTPEMVRQMDEIEKLARSVKEKMRN